MRLLLNGDLDHLYRNLGGGVYSGDHTMNLLDTHDQRRGGCWETVMNYINKNRLLPELSWLVLAMDRVKDSLNRRGQRRAEVGSF